MKALQQYLDTRVNFFRKFRNEAPMTLPLSAANIAVLTDDLACDLSPENLNCDGEISRAEAQRRYNFYMRVVRDLERAAGHRIDIESMY